MLLFRSKLKTYPKYPRRVVNRVQACPIEHVEGQDIDASALPDALGEAHPRKKSIAARPHGIAVAIPELEAQMLVLNVGVHHRGSIIAGKNAPAVQVVA